MQISDFYVRRAYRNLIFSLLSITALEDRPHFTHFVKSTWCRELCDGVDVSYRDYREWAKERVKALPEKARWRPSKQNTLADARERP